ncbi:MAG: TatD family hydrolase [Planctomycetota bacterium]|nr:TatD family hydrolase [Planctomycetota bacterium]
MKLFDSHCHLQWHEDQDPVPARLQRAKDAGVAACICVGVDIPSSKRACKLSTQHEMVYSSVGLHPNDLPENRVELEEQLSLVQELSQDPSCIAIGETGLDFFRDQSDPDLQRESFRRHLEIASDVDLPVIIHCRDAYPEAAQLLENFGAPISGVMHCWSSGPDHVQAFLDLGLHISFAGNASYPKSEELRESARIVPSSRILIETDAPFLSPQPKRGKRNEPAYIRHTLDCLAETRSVSAEELAQTTWTNSMSLFGLK